MNTGKREETMRMLRMMALLLLCLMLACPALAEVSFLPAADNWDLASMPLEMDLSAEVKTHMPFDDNRLAQLAAITDRLSLRLKWQNLEDEVQTHAAFFLDDEIVLSMGQQQTEQETLLQLSSTPDITYAAGQDPLGLLLGESTRFTSVYGVDGSEQAWLEEGYSLLMALEEALRPYLSEERKVSTSIENIGKASLMQDYAVAKADAPQLTALLTGVCPEGRLKDLIGSLVFSGKQTLRVYRNKDGVPLRMEYNGNCGTDEDHLRDVQLVWRLRRDGTAYRDEITLKSPALRGTDKNTITYSCVISKNSKGVLSLKAELSYTKVKDKVKTVLSGEANLKNTPKKEQSQVTGEAWLKQKIDDESAQTMVFEPELLIAGDAENPEVTGSITVKEKLGSSVMEEAVIRLSLKRAPYSSWNMRARTVDLSALDAAALAQAQQEVVQAVSADLVRSVIRALREDAAYFFQDLPQETIMQLIEAADQY